MRKVISDIRQYRKEIESAYIIGSYGTSNYRYSSDLDIVVIVKDSTLSKPLYRLKEKYHFTDVMVLNKNLIECQINKSPSYYLSAINQVQLNSIKICGSDFIKQIKLCPEKILYNQLHFPLYAFEKILRYNNKSGSDIFLRSYESFKCLRMGFEFMYENKKYYNYRPLATLILTICSYKLIRQNKFDFARGGKHWFMDDYLNYCQGDESYSFIAEYDQFSQAMNSCIFEGRSVYLESDYFKKNLFLFLSDYFAFKNSNHFCLT